MPEEVDDWRLISADADWGAMIIATRVQDA